MTITITAFERSPDGGKGLARDTRVRWALEEVGQPYQVRLVSFAAMKEPAHLRGAAGGQQSVGGLSRARDGRRARPAAAPAERRAPMSGSPMSGSPMSGSPMSGSPMSGSFSWWAARRSGIANGMSYIMVDIESDGPAPGLYSMVCFGAIVVSPGLSQTFYGKTRPISERWNAEALAVSGFSREQHQAFDDPAQVMRRFADWIARHGGRRPIFISDNNGFDWSFINYYFHCYLEKNPFGFSSQNLGSLYKGLVKDTFSNFKHLRRTRHSHDPVDDARGNAEALLEMKKMGLNLALD